MSVDPDVAFSRRLLSGFRRWGPELVVAAVVFLAVGWLIPWLRWELGSPEGEYSFLVSVGGEPVGWDACEPIRWAVAYAPGISPSQRLRLRDEVSAAVDEVEAATAFRFELVGESPVIPTLQDWGAWTDVPPNPAVVLAFTDGTLTDAYREVGDTPTSPGRDAQAAAFVTYRTAGLKKWLDSGAAVFDPGYVLDPSSDAGGLHKTYLHELGHLLGLDHVSDPASVMVPYSVTGHRAFSAGDLAGLGALAARSECG